MVLNAYSPSLYPCLLLRLLSRDHKYWFLKEILLFRLKVDPGPNRPTWRSAWRWFSEANLNGAGGARLELDLIAREGITVDEFKVRCSAARWYLL